MWRMCGEGATTHEVVMNCLFGYHSYQRRSARRRLSPRLRTLLLAMHRRNEYQHGRGGGQVSGS